MADVIVPISGWGYSTWGDGQWDVSPATPTATGAVGSVTVVEGPGVSVTLTGCQGTTSLCTAET